jgi:hypothetical protein
MFDFGDRNYRLTKTPITCGPFVVLARLRLNMPTCIQQYKLLSVRIFGDQAPNFCQSIKGARSCRFSVERLSEAVQDVARQALSGAALQHWKTLLRDDDSVGLGTRSCRTAVVASYLNKLGAKHRIFLPDGPEMDTIGQAARATSAVPTYFEGIEIDGNSYGRLRV